jgi:O-antigen/teichoic acid export membrane protein
MRCTLGLFGAVAGGLVVFAARFLTVWVGRSFATSADIVLLLTFGGLFEVLLWPATGVLQAMDRHRPLVVFALASAALNLGLSIALIGALGVRGVAVATLIATAAEALFVVPYATRVLRVGGRALLMRVALPSLIPAIPMVAVLLAVRVAVAPTSIPMIALCGLAGAFVYGACYLAFPAAKTERAAAATLIAGTGALVRRARDRALPPARQPRLPIGTAGARPVPASGWLAEHLHDRLYRTGYYLIVGTGITSLLGVAFWALAAHTYSARDVGLDAAAISAMTLVSGACSLDLTAVFVRYLPIAGDAAHKLVSRSYAVTVALSLIFGLAAALSSSLWSTKLAFLGGGGWLVGFTLATAATTVFTLEDGVLTGLQAARWIPLENSLYSLAKLVLLVCLTGLLPGAGPFVAWNLPLVPVVFVVNYFIFRRLISRRSAPGTLNRREVVAMTASNHGGNLLALAGTLYLPVLVANLAGAASAAYFYVPWLISLSLQLIAINVMASLTVEAALDPSRLRTLARRSLGHSLRLVVPLVVLAAVVAPWGLLAFGHAYSHAGTGLLRWLALAAVPNVVVSLGITVARIEHRGWIVVAVQGVNSAIVITLSALLLHHHGIASVGLAWAASQTLVAAVLFATILRPVLLAPRRSQTPAGAS